MSLYRIHFGTQSYYVVAASMAKAITLAEDKNQQFFARAHASRVERLGEVHVEPGCY